jgi:hypothetical protein
VVLTKNHLRVVLFSNKKNIDEVVVVNLAAESVKSATLALQSVHDVHGRDGLAACVLSVGDSITYNILEENLEHTTGLFVDKTGNALDTTTACKTADGGLCDTLDIVTQNFAVTAGSALAESFSSFSTSGHYES